MRKQSRQGHLIHHISTFILLPPKLFPPVRWPTPQCPRIPCGARPRRRSLVDASALTAKAQTAAGGPMGPVNRS